MLITLELAKCVLLTQADSFLTVYTPRYMIFTSFPDRYWFKSCNQLSHFLSEEVLIVLYSIFGQCLLFWSESVLFVSSSP